MFIPNVVRVSKKEPNFAHVKLITKKAYNRNIIYRSSGKFITLKFYPINVTAYVTPTPEKKVCTKYGLFHPTFKFDELKGVRVDALFLIIN